MSEPVPPYWPPPPALDATPPQRRTGPDRSVLDDLGFGLFLAAAITLLGGVLGLVWAAWSPPGPRALVLSPGVRQPDETESWIAGDGRFLVLAVVAGLVTGFVAWRRLRNRGPIVLQALVYGGLLGSLLMELVGHLTGGGTFDGKPNTIIDVLPLSLHMQGLLFVQPAVAALLYGLLVAFAVRDDLGRPDPVRDGLRPVPAAVGGPSVGAGDQPQDGWRHGDAAGALQQGDLPPQ